MAGPLPFPEIDPVIFAIGPLAVRWYALAYIVGLVGGWGYIVWLLRRPPATMTAEAVGDFVTWAIVGVILGGRLGYVIFYNPGHFLAHPLEILALWDGGMSFHGGLAGVALAIVAFAKKRGIAVLSLADLIACAAPIGLFLGRVANFVNGELYGRPTDVPWAVAFPAGGGIGRHPSQLYEAALEGLVLFVVLLVLVRATRARWRPGLLTGVFLSGYGLARIAVEFVREPDPQLGFLFAGATMGQLLSLPLALAGAGLLVWALTRPEAAPGRASPPSR